MSGLAISVGIIAASLTPSRLAAQGEDNPTGVTGIYNGNVTSGCSYDPYTENALRVVDDIVVPGCVGAYPLKWTRYNNSRHEGVGYDGWSFSYAYALDAAALIATFPDGRVISWWDPPVDPAVEEHIGTWNGYEAIFLGDGGKAVFNETTPGATNFLVTSVVDPYGNRTAISYDIVAYTPQGDPIYQRSRITEPGGRYLQIYWDSVLPVYNRHVTGVQAFDGRGNLIETVNYVGGSITNGTETFTTLAGANYDDGTSASYTYEIIGGTNSHRPAIVTADDVRNPSPLRQIMYNHVAGGKGGIGWEKKLSGELLSSITYTGANTRTETRGDNATRTFTYGNRAGGAHQMGKLIDYSDFAGKHTTLGYESNMWSLAYGFLTTVTDSNNHTTTYTRSTASWAITKITFPDTSFIEQTFTDEANPYYLASRTARRGPTDPAHITTYTRDANHRITRKDYPDGAFEEFVYNSFGQVLDHHMTSGGWEHFAYDPRGLKTSYTDALGNMTTYSYYSPGDANFPAWADRLKTVTHPANISGFQQTETYEYDRVFVNGVDTGAACGGRGLVTKVTHTDGSTITTTHNKWGDVLTATDELVHTTTNTYDGYGRLLTTADPLNHTTTNSYIPFGQTNSYVTNSHLPWTTTLPSGKQTKTYYDANWRKTRVQQAPGTGDEANSYFTYDNVGNLLTSKDPRNNITTNHYDVCDRVDSVTAPAPASRASAGSSCSGIPRRMTTRLPRSRRDPSTSCRQSSMNCVREPER